MIHSQTAFLVVALLYVALPVTAWTILHRRHDPSSVNLWCVGGLCLGCAFILFGFRGAIPDWLSILVASPLAFLAYLLRTLALRRELGLINNPASIAAGAAVWVLVSLAYVAAYHFSTVQAPRLLVALLAHLAGAAWLAWLAWSLYRRRHFRSAAMLAGAYLFFAATLVVRMVSVIMTWETAQSMSGTLDFVLTVLSGVAAALYSNLGYIGIALETAQAQELNRSVDLAREQERRLQTEERVKEQRDLLDQRGRLLTEREEMLATLAHEVRQPLNNASAALQSASETLLKTGEEHEQAASRVQRAGAVLAAVTSALDNTLADAVLLSGSEPTMRQDIDIDTLAALAIADIDPSQRTRVGYERTTDARTASVNASLVRLALRNVVANALAYAPAESPVLVRISDCEDPLALVIEVHDQGGGFSEALLPRLFHRGARGVHASSRHGHGLGLHIVRRVMELHGGHASIARNSPGHVIVRMTMPQQVEA